ncbi:precorrin-3B C(17)-methyltransferase [Nocardioides mangrovicus]|uniref:Precorrin-3B C(17)-methyltransferase n=1 Tax=Nocardioides mangrovicus TaxID=2478913 RepID=A0A3L8P7L8_9ACTN|nr:precorrin-3B C(17)-methyltransferase [Nocardioides mangrovicus]RLV50368.1 precorrin-3B C(17)-methyltransferase [Nocardioides mangrovicus]
MSGGRFTVVGLGPGDPDLLTLKAVRVIGEADVVAYHAGVSRSSHARRIADAYLPEAVVEEELRYPVTTGTTDHPGGYAGAMADFYDETEQRLRTHLDAGRHVVLVSEGDPLFYGSSMYMHDRLREAYPTDVVPGIPAFAAAEAASGVAMVRQSDVLTVLPGTLPEPELARRLADTDGALIMKLGRTFPAVVRALEAAGRLDDAVYVERASQDEERVLPVRDVDPASVPYFSLVLVRSRHEAAAATPVPDRAPAELLVVGLGPGPNRWLTGEVAEALAGVDHVVGYGPYVERVPQRPGLQRHASGNTVEVDRARFALDLARRGERVAVVSGGDAGVFGMAAAVFEVADEFPEVEVRVLPGVSAVQAVAARAGAPVGADFAVLSLSDRLKPWSVVERRLRAVAEADLVLAIYNPASRSRTEQVGEAQKILLEHRSADTVVVVGRDVGRAEESLHVTTLAELDPASVDMKCLLIVGASATRVTGGRVWTPRSVT